MTDSTATPDYTPAANDIEEMAKKLAPLRSPGNGNAWAKTASPLVGPKIDRTMGLTYSTVKEGLDKLLARMNEVRGMAEATRERLTREQPKMLTDNPLVEPDDRDMPVFEHFAHLTVRLSREIELTEKHLALALAALK